MKSYEFDKKFITNEIDLVDTELLTEGGAVQVKIPVKRRKASLKTLLDLKEQHQKTKPKRFIWYIIPNSLYKFDMVDWEWLDKKLTQLLTFNKPLDLDTTIIWYG